MTEPPLAKRGKILPEDSLAVLVLDHGTAATTAATDSMVVVSQLSQLPEDVLCRISSHLDAASLLRLSQVNHFYHTLCRQNCAGWENLCCTLWQRKVHVCQKARDHVQRSALEAYRMAWEDAAQRQNIRLEEFCYNPETGQGTVWSFRFKESAGADWTSVDPWYQALPCRQMVFIPDGNAQRGKVQHGKVQQYVVQENGQPVLIDPAVSMTWRFLTRPMDLPRRLPGSYVRLTAAGRDVPTYSIRRSPNKNWGFVMESCWGLYASFPLPPRKKRLLTPRRTAADGVAWVRADENENASGTSTNHCSGEQQHGMEHADEHYDPLQDDSELVITNEIQWREAFLYNVGARVLPEGDLATDEFDRAWGGGP